MASTTYVSACELDRLMAVMDAAFDPLYGEAWTRRQVEDALLVGNCQYFLISKNGNPPFADEDAAGFVLSRNTVEEEELLLFAVMPEYRRRGLGQNMLEKLVGNALNRGAIKLLLEVRNNNPAQSLYLNFGFKPVGIRPNYYKLSDGSRLDATTFSLSLLDRN